jgi:CcmD family protein
MTYLFLGYTVVWTLLFIYFLYISGRQRALEREMAWLRDHLPPAPGSGSPGARDAGSGERS